VADAMPKMTLQEMGETISMTKYVGDWGPGGEMRSFMGDEPKEPSTSLERAAMMAYELAVMDGVSMAHGAEALRPGSALGRSLDAGPGGIDRRDRDDLLEVLSAGLRIAIVDERENGRDGRSDVDRARLVLVSMAMVKSARERADGMEPAPLENRVLESARRKSGLESSILNAHDAHRLGTGMIDLIDGEGAMRQVLEAVKGARTPMRDDALEDRLRMADASWPAVRPRETEKPVSATRGSADASVPLAAMGRAADRGR
jgi:hypothetical protein